MKAVILAAGRGCRMGVLTAALPKPLIRVHGKTLIERTLDALPECVTECIVVIGYRGSDITSFLGTSYSGRRISYVWQEHAGTGGALYSVRTHFSADEAFLVVGADDIFGPGELEVLVCGTASYGITHGIPRANSSFSVLFNTDEFLLDWCHVSVDVPRFYGVGAYVLFPGIFTSSLYRLKGGEYSIPHSLPTMPFPVKVRHIQRWIPVNTPEDIVYAEEMLKTQNSNYGT